MDAIAPHEIADEDKRFLDLCSFEEELDSQPLIAPKPPSGQLKMRRLSMSHFDFLAVNFSGVISKN